MKILIAGGGIGGLSAALALARDGHDISVAERAEIFAPIGAGIVLAPNATHVLSALAVDVSKHGRALPHMAVVDRDGAPLLQVEPERVAAEYGPIYALDRPALHDALLAAVAQKSDRITVRTNTALESLVIADREVRVQFATSSGAAGEPFDLVIGADGINSLVRSIVCGRVPLRYSGVTCWRGIVQDFPLHGALEIWAGANRFGLVPLRDNRAYYFLVRTAPRRAPALRWPEGFAAAFGEVRAEPARHLFARLDGVPPLHHDLEELDRPVWGHGRVVLLGDAAHAMTPNQGQGAAMAIEDAVALALALRPGLDGLLPRYLGLRAARVRRVQLDSRRLGEMAHWRSRISCRLRDGLLRAVPASLSNRQYRRVVEPGIELARRIG